MQAAVSDIIVGALEQLNLSYPTVGEKELAELKLGQEMLAQEGK